MKYKIISVNSKHYFNKMSSYKDTRRKDKFEKSKKRFENHKPRYEKDKKHVAKQGVKYDKHRLTLLADDTLKIIAIGKCNDNDISKQLNEAKENTILYKENDIIFSERNISLGKTETDFEVVHESTLDGCLRLHGEDFQKIICLNFASAKNPGGGFLKGSNAQEESLARSSGLHHCIAENELYYINGQDNNNYLYSHGMIYSPNVPVFRNEYGKLIDPYKVSFITCPAVNAGHAVSKVDQKVIDDTMCERIDRILYIASINEPDVLVLGAFGCGVFGNDSQVVAEIMMKLLTTKYQGVFKQVTFSLIDIETHEIFDKVTDKYL